MTFKFIKANNGDSILISFLDKEKIHRNILIDGGMPKTYWDGSGNKYGDLKLTLDEVKARNEKIDLLILTHIDQDHIGGIKKWFSKDPDAYRMISNIWFNSGKLIAEHFKEKENPELIVLLDIFSSSETSVSEAVHIEKYISEHGIWDKQLIKSGDNPQPFGLNFKILSPSEDLLLKLVKEYEVKDKDYFTAGEESDFNKTIKSFIEEESLIGFKFEEDDKSTNGSSIAFILSHDDKNYLFLGDSHPSVICDSLKKIGHSKDCPLIVEFVKISHHGSSYNTCLELLELIKTGNYIICTSGEKHSHPHKRTLARIVRQNPYANIYFNYKNIKESIILPIDISDYPSFTSEEITYYPLQNE